MSCLSAGLASRPKRPVLLKYWLFLMLAIVLEVGGTAIMKFSLDMEGMLPQCGYVIMLVCIGWSYYFLALSTQKLPVGVAFACWEGLGLTLITICSVVLLGESMSWMRVGGLVAILCGVMLIHHGTEQPGNEKNTVDSTQAAGVSGECAQGERS